MKSISIILASIFCAASPELKAEVGMQKAEMPKAEQISSSQFELGTEAIARIRTAYSNGDYDSFLKEMDDSYKALPAASLTSFADIRTATPTPIDTQKWEEILFQLQKQKNQELINALPSDDETLFGKKVRNIATDQTTPEQEKALLQLAQYRQMAPLAGKNSDENRLIDLDLEYEYKTVHLDSPTTPIPDRREKQYILRMEKMNQILEASKSFQDESLKEQVQLAAENLDGRLSQSWDATDLKALSKGKIKPEGRTQQKVAAILTSYQDQFNDILLRGDRF
ncbi:MAG TPA: hypothetical protein VLE89_06805 [Chlamydiales bacterium]|nr:hypothetical protein [Chlamydiales bacterium]